jgi:hypothetical protein
VFLSPVYEVERAVLMYGVGELWQSERDTRAYADIVGERDKKGA